MINPVASLRVLKRAVLSTILVATTVCGGLHAAPAETANWEATGWGGGGYFYCAVYHPTQDGVIYLGGDVAGGYKTTDNGRNWRFINNGIPAYGVFSLAVDRSNPQTVYAATEEGLSKSTDGGENWVTLPNTGKKELRITGEKKKSIRAITVDPSNGDNLYAASPLGKIYKSTDGGQTWAVSYEKAASSEDAGVLRAQYGKINGAYFGDLWFNTAFPADAKASEAIGIGFTLKGDGSVPKDSFLILRAKTGVTYRSKNLNTLYQDTGWRDIVLTAADFALDPDYLKKHPDAAAGYTGPDWASIVRVDLPCSGPLPSQATVAKFKRFFFALAPATTSGNPRLSTILDFAKPEDVKAVNVIANLRLGAPASETMSGVAVAPSNPSWVVAASHDTGLLLSKDAGRTWTELPTPKKAASATFDPSNANIIYGAFFTDGVHKSTDGGQTWTSLSTDWKNKISILEVAVSTANPLDVYAISNLNWGGIVYRSNDGGKTWKTANQIQDIDLTANPTLDNVNVAARTTNLSAPTNITINPRNPKEIFVSANWRNVLSTDGGATWLHRDRGADISCATDIRFHQGKTYVTNMDEGTLVSDDNGKSWRQLWPLKHETPISGHNWRVAVTEVNGATRVIIASSPWSETPPHIVRSDDAGKTFNVIKTGLPDYIVRPNTMWGQGYPRALAVDPNNPQTVYLGIDGDPAGGKMGGGVFKSEDGGTTWNQLPNQPGSRRMYFGLAVDPTDSKRIFWGAAGDKGGLYRSSDSGASWEKVFSNETWIWNVVATADGTIYCSGQQLWCSTDHGKTWKQLTRFTHKRAVVGIEVHPRDPKTIWVSETVWDNSAKGAISKTTDGGATWTDITGDIPYIRPQVLRFNPETNELWAGYVGLYKIRQ